LSTHLRLGLPSCLFLSGSPTNILYPHSCYMPCSPHPPWLYHSNYIWRGVQVMKLLIMHSFLQPPVTSSLFGQIFSSVLCFPNTLSLCSSLNIRDLVSHPYRTTGKIVVSYIRIFMFLDSRREDKWFWTEW
jgi:hypothetical protein